MSRRCLWPSKLATVAQLDATAPANVIADTLTAAESWHRYTNRVAAAFATAATENSTPVAACVNELPPYQGLLHASVPAKQPLAEAVVDLDWAGASSGSQEYAQTAVPEASSFDGHVIAFDCLMLALSGDVECTWQNAMPASTRKLEYSPAVALRQGDERLPWACCKLLPALLVQH